MKALRGIQCNRGRSRGAWELRIAALIALAAITACAPRGTAPPPMEVAPARPSAAGLVANLRGVGSAMSGKVRVVDRGDGVSVAISAINLPQIYRVAFHQNGNCSSPNGFSAGPAWAPAGLSPTKLAPLLMNADGNGEAEFHVSGVHTTGENGLAGRSVMLYFGYDIEPVKPDVRNNVVACGVFEPAQLLF
jgi:Cu/Zn superoxide dismutase